MKIDFTQQLTYVDGKPMVVQTIENDPVSIQPFTLRMVAVNSLEGTYEKEGKISRDEKLKRDILAEKIMQDDVIDLKSDEVALIVKLVDYNYDSPRVFRQAYEMLEREKVLSKRTAKEAPIKNIK